MASAWKDGPAQRLDHLVRAAGVSKAHLGRQLGVSGSTVHRWCSGDRTPNADELGYILEIIGGSADEVLDLPPSSLDAQALSEIVTFAQRVVTLAPQLRRSRAGKK